LVIYNQGKRQFSLAAKYRNRAPELISGANPATKPTHCFYFHNLQVAAGNHP
jgi:hypothetical protein